MLRNLIIATLAATVAGCSGGSPAAPTPTPPPVAGTTPVAPSGPPTITITASGMTPLEITINVGQRVTFVNNDTRPHDVVGGRDPNNPDCPEIVQAGFLAPGQRGETGVFTTARTCEYHDHTMLSVPAFQGRIIIR
jgi:plastocyanin